MKGVNMTKPIVVSTKSYRMQGGSDTNRRTGSSSGLHRKLLDLGVRRKRGGGVVRWMEMLVGLILGAATMFVWCERIRKKRDVGDMWKDAVDAVDAVDTVEDVEMDSGAVNMRNMQVGRDNPVQPAGQGSEMEEKIRTRKIEDLDYITPRDMEVNKEMNVPSECLKWRQIAGNESLVHPYRKHFTSLDVIDWFTYVSLFDEDFHHKRVQRHRRPRYIDIAANHARKWSSTWFFDRCMGWDGVCVEANPKYHRELVQERHCHLVRTCVSDREKIVRFSMTDAYGGVVKERGKERFGVDGGQHANLEKFKEKFQGVRELRCTTVANEVSRLGYGHFDFMSLDVEGHELPVLRGVPWQNITIDVIVTENRSLEVRGLMAKLGYDLYEGVLKDFVYVRKGSGLVPNPKFIDMAKRMNRNTYLFAPPK